MRAGVDSLSSSTGMEAASLGEEARLVEADWGGVLTTEEVGRLWEGEPHLMAEDVVEDGRDGGGDEEGG